jgi:hypothetical protein
MPTGTLKHMIAKLSDITAPPESKPPVKNRNVSNNSDLRQPIGSTLSGWESHKSVPAPLSPFQKLKRDTMKRIRNKSNLAEQLEFARTGVKPVTTTHSPVVRLNKDIPKAPETVKVGRAAFVVKAAARSNSRDDVTLASDFKS